MVPRLDPDIRDATFDDLRAARQLAKDGRSEEAEAAIRRAWVRIPEPRLSWDVSGIIVAAIARFHRDNRNFPEAIAWAEEHVRCNTLPKNGSPLILLGSVHYAAGDLETAWRHFRRAFELSGKRAFADERPEFLELARSASAPLPEGRDIFSEEPPHHLAFLESRVDLTNRKR